MKHRRLLRLTCAACLLLCGGSFAYRAAAATLHNLSAASRHTKAATPQPCTMLYGKQLFTLGGYELDASFTPDGRFYGFEISKSGV